MPRSSASSRTMFGCVMVEGCVNGACRSRPKIRGVTRGDLKHRRGREASDLAIHHSPCMWPETLDAWLQARPLCPDTEGVLSVYHLPKLRWWRGKCQDHNFKISFPDSFQVPMSSLTWEFTCSRWHTSDFASWLWMFIEGCSGKLRMGSTSSDIVFAWTEIFGLWKS